MKIEVTEEFKKFPLHKQTYSTQTVVLYILLNKVNNEIEIPLKVTSKEINMTVVSLWLALKKLKQLNFITKIAKSTYKINDKYVK